MRWFYFCLCVFSFSPAQADSIEGFTKKVDPDLIGTWQYAFLTYATDTLVIEKAGVVHQKGILSDKLFQDTDGTMEFDMSTKPKRLIVTITRVNPDQVVKMKVGDKYLCLYERIKNFLTVECSDKGKFPDFINDGYGYGKIK